MQVPLRSPSIQQAWADFLSVEPFDAFLTVTQDMNDTRKLGKAKLLTEESRLWKQPRRCHPEQMVKRFYYCRNLLNRARYGRSWHKHDHLAVSAVVGIERHASYSAHAHALLRIPGDFTESDRLHWQDVFTASGGWCKLEFPRSQGDTVDYVTKYVCKDDSLEITPNFAPVTRSPEFAFATSPGPT